MKLNKFVSRLCYSICSLFMIASVQATAAPLWTFSPLTPTTMQVPTNSTAIVQYTVTNRSARPHTLMMLPISGVTQVTSAGNCSASFVLAAQQSCTLTLQVNGNQNVIGGPQICQQGSSGNPSPQQCYQPSSANSLNVTLITPQVPTLYTGAQNGTLYYSINNGTTWTATTAPAAGNAINSVVASSTTLYAGVANGTVYASIDKGRTWSPITTPAPGFAVNGLYVSATKLYVASASGKVFICTLGGMNCLPTNPPDSVFAVNGVFANGTTLYAASADGSVYYSNDQGATWNANNQPDGNSVKTVYIANNTLYAGTAAENVYVNTSLTGSGAWSWYGQTVYSLFVNSDASQILAGTQGGYIFSLNTGTKLGFVTYSPITSVFLLG